MLSLSSSSSVSSLSYLGRLVHFVLHVIIIRGFLEKNLLSVLYGLYLDLCLDYTVGLWIHVCFLFVELLVENIIYVVPPQSWGDRSDTKHSKCLLLGGRRLNQLTLIPKPKGSGGARAATAQVGPANNRNDTKRCLPIEASLRPGEAVPW